MANEKELTVYIKVHGKVFDVTLHGVSLKVEDEDGEDQTVPDIMMHLDGFSTLLTRLAVLQLAAKGGEA